MRIQARGLDDRAAQYTGLVGMPSQVSGGRNFFIEARHQHMKLHYKLFDMLVNIHNAPNKTNWKSLDINIKRSVLHLLCQSWMLCM